MGKKVSVRKGVNVVLTISMIGVGSSLYIPSVYAADNEVPLVINVQNTSANLLSQLEIEGVQLDQPFSQQVSQYSATVDHSIDKINILPGTDDKQTAITINGQSVTNGVGTTFQLQTGVNTFIIVVNDGKNVPNTYTLTVTRKLSSNNLLKSLIISKGTLSPVFNPDITSYKVHETADVDKLLITPESVEQSSVVKVNNMSVSSSGALIPISIGKSTITIQVTAENGDKKTYTIEVTRDAQKTPSTGGNSSPSGLSGKSGNSLKGKTRNQSSLLSSRSKGNFGSAASARMSPGASQQGRSMAQKVSKATLSSLTISNGTWNKTFSKDEYTYHIAEGADVTSVTLSENPTYSGATVTVKGGTSNTIEIGDNEKTIVPIVVTKDSEHKTYVIVFDKDVPPPTEKVPSSDSAIAIDNTLTTNQPYSVLNANYNGNKNTKPISWWGKLLNKIESIF